MPFPARKIGLRSGAYTSVGQVRENNEDSIHVSSNNDWVIAVVADGMGGAVAGEEASKMAVEAVKHGLTELPAEDSEAKLRTEQIAQKLRTVIRAGNEDIVQRAINNPALRGMGTTVTLAYVRYTHAVIAHVGDSRAYLVSNNSLPRIQQITADHSFVDALVLAGHLTPEQAEEHPMRHVLYRALGQTEELDIDVYQTRLRPGDHIVLCSDGLTRHVKAQEIADIVLEQDDPDKASQMLVMLANERGGEDNVSVIVVTVDGNTLPDETPMLVMAVNMGMLGDDSNDTVPMQRPLDGDTSPLAKIDSGATPSPESADQVDTLPDREQLDKRARLLQLQWLVDEVLLDSDPLDKAINRRDWIGEHATNHTHIESENEEGGDPRIPRL
jgi:PPM family protein phosphatase